MRIYADIPDEMLERISMFQEKKPYKATRNAVMIELLDRALKEEGL